jgi:membrane protein DedA with SNARE-associated domain
LTVVAASTAGLSPTRALPALLLGSTVFVQAHFVLGYLFGPAVLEVFEQALPVALALAGLVLIVAAVVWLRRRGAEGGAQAFEEAGCPVCMVVGAVGDRLLAVRPASPPPG